MSQSADKFRGKRLINSVLLIVVAVFLLVIVARTRTAPLHNDFVEYWAAPGSCFGSLCGCECTDDAVCLLENDRHSLHLDGASVAADLSRHSMGNRSRKTTPRDGSRLGWGGGKNRYGILKRS